MLSVLVHLEAMRLSILSFSAHPASLLLTSDVKGRCQSGREGAWPPPPTGHLTAVGRAEVTLQPARVFLFCGLAQLAQCLTAKLLCEWV
jgi:hypothetical protein